jgi:hypothetical protein
MNEPEDKKFIEPPNIASDTVTAIFTTRSANDRPESLAEEMNISKKNIYLPIQKHTDRVHVVESGMETVVADAILTKRRGILIGVRVADCVPILLLDRKKQAVGAVHAGWKGTSKQILRNTIDKMKRKFFSSPEDIMVAIGPCIRGCCYEVSCDVRDSVEDATGKGNYSMKKDGRYYIDLSSANYVQAVSSGIPETNIWRSGECTFCNHEKFFSYRYEKGNTGRQGAFVGMW